MSRKRASSETDTLRGGFILAAIFFVQALVLFLLDSDAWWLMAAWCVIFLLLTLPAKGSKR